MHNNTIVKFVKIHGKDFLIYGLDFSGLVKSFLYLYTMKEANRKDNWKRISNLDKFNIVYSALKYLNNSPTKQIKDWNKCKFVLLTYSTMKRHTVHGKHKDVMVESLLDHVSEEDLIVLEKKQKGMAREPSYYQHENTAEITGIFVKIIAKICTIIFNNKVRKYNENLTIFKLPSIGAKLVQIIFEVILLKYYYKWKLNKSSITDVYIVSQMSVDSMALCLAASELNISSWEVQHGNIISTSLIYNQKEEGYLNYPYFADKFIVKNKRTVDILSSINRINSPESCLVSGRKYLNSPNSNKILMCIGPDDIPHFVYQTIKENPKYDFFIRLHPGFGMPLKNYNLSNALSLNNCSIQEGMSLQDAVSQSSLIMTGASTIIIDLSDCDKCLLIWSENASSMYIDFIKSFYIFSGVISIVTHKEKLS
jgi:hypothetical protein